VNTTLAVSAATVRELIQGIIDRTLIDIDDLSDEVDRVALREVLGSAGSSPIKNKLIDTRLTNLIRQDRYQPTIENRMKYAVF